MQNVSIKEILLVDDDADECMLFELALKELDANIRFVHASSCSAALKELESCNADLIFLDLKLRADSGYDCLKAIKASARLCNIPVVMYSGSQMPKDITLSYQHGAALYFNKSDSFGALVNALRDILSLPWHEPEELRMRFLTNGTYSAKGLSAE